MTNRERLDKFKSLYKLKEDFTILLAITTDDKFLGVVYKKIEIKSKKTGIKDIAESHIHYSRVNTIQEFIKNLEPYIIKKEILIETT
jgi:Mg/Co/Ni transporter MgtE